MFICRLVAGEYGHMEVWPFLVREDIADGFLISLMDNAKYLSSQELAKQLVEAMSIAVGQ